jgi:hypothetical protein
MRNFTLEKTVPIRLMVLDSEINRIEIKNYQFTFTLATDGTSYDDVLDAQLDQNISFSKIMYFLESVVDQSFVYDREMMEDINKYVATTFDNNLLILPDTSENVLVIALHSKINSFISKNSIVERINVKDVEPQMNYDYFCDEKEDVAAGLPSQKEWMGELPFWEKPWWERNDASTYDNFALDKEEHEQWIKTKNDNEFFENPHDDAFETIESEITRLFKGEEVAAAEAEVIEVDFREQKKKWVPKIV